MRSWVSLLVLAAVVAVGVVAYRNKDQVVAFLGFNAPSGSAAPAAANGAAPAPGAPAPGGQAQAGGPGGGPGGPAGPGGARTPRAPAAVITVAAEQKDVPQNVSAVGWVEASATAAVRTRVDGYVVKQGVTDGQMVKQGELLFQLDDAAIQATIAQHRAVHDRDQATVNQLTADVARQQALADNNVGTRTQLDQTRTNLAVAQANLLADKAILQADQIQLGYTTITAPIAGRVGVVNTTVGALVRANDQNPLLTITRMNPVRITFNVPQRQLDAIRAAMAGTRPAAVHAYDAETGQHLSQGVLTFVDSVLDTTTGAVMVKAEFANADGELWPGQYLRVETQVGTYTGVTVVPQAAVQMNAAGAFVYLVRDGRAVLQPVTVTENVAQSAIIASGIRPGDHVIVEGAVRLVNNAQVVETFRSADGVVAGGARTAPANPAGAEASARPAGTRPAGAGGAPAAAGAAAGAAPAAAGAPPAAAPAPGGGQNPAAAGGGGQRQGGAGAPANGAPAGNAGGGNRPNGNPNQQRPAGANQPG